MDLNEATMQIPLATCTLNGGQIAARLDLKIDGRAWLFVFARSSDHRRSSLIYILNQDGLDELEALVKKAKDAIATLQTEGRLKKLEADWV